MTDQPTLAERLAAILALCHRYGRVQPPDPGLVESIRLVAAAAHEAAVKVDAWAEAENVDAEVWRREALRARAEADANRQRWIAAAEIANDERGRRQALESTPPVQAYPGTVVLATDPLSHAAGAKVTARIDDRGLVIVGVEPAAAAVRSYLRSDAARWRAWAETTYERAFDDGRSSAAMSDAELMQAIKTLVADAKAWRIQGTAMAHAAESPRARVFADISAERERQDVKWGPVRKQPNVDPVLAARGADHQRIAAQHEIPTADRAKFLCRTAASRGECSFTDIVVEELAEAVEVHDDPVRLREELVQTAASVVKWIEALDIPEVAT